MDRSKFIKKGIAASLGITLFPHMATSYNLNQVTRLDGELVYEFVKIAHGDFDKVKRMLRQTPSLLHASHDWGNGDFETALGAASHIGHQDIARWLIEKGARYNLFSAAMLGDLVTVKQALTTYPTLIIAKGPHGLDMIHHAKVGGSQAEEVLSFLESLSANAKEELPDRKDIAFAETPYEIVAVKLVDFFHDQSEQNKLEFIDTYFESQQKGEEFFNLVLDKIKPPASIVELKGASYEECRLILTKTDNTTNYYFKLAFTQEKPYKITKIMASGSRKVLDVPFPVD